MAKAKAATRKKKSKTEPETATCANCEAEIMYLAHYGYWVHSDDYLRGCYPTYVATPE